MLKIISQAIADGHPVVLCTIVDTEGIVPSPCRRKDGSL